MSWLKNILKTIDKAGEIMMHQKAKRWMGEKKYKELMKKNDFIVE